MGGRRPPLLYSVTLKQTVVWPSDLGRDNAFRTGTAPDRDVVKSSGWQRCLRTVIFAVLSGQQRQAHLGQRALVNLCRWLNVSAPPTAPFAFRISRGVARAI